MYCINAQLRRYGWSGCGLILETDRDRSALWKFEGLHIRSLPPVGEIEHEACLLLHSRSYNNGWVPVINRQFNRSTEAVNKNTKFNGRVSDTTIPFSSKFIFWPRLFRHFSTVYFRYQNQQYRFHSVFRSK